MSEKRSCGRKQAGRPPINDLTRTLVRRLRTKDRMPCGDIAAACNISARSVFRILSKTAGTGAAGKK